MIINTIKYIITAVILSMFLSTGCGNDNSVIPEDTTMPVIASITADKTEILFGGNDPAVITCIAEGGSLQFKWEVDLGDIFKLKNDNSVVRFTGSPCCIGKKIIKCTVSNDKGSVSQNIDIIIKEK